MELAGSSCGLRNRTFPPRRIPVLLEFFRPPLLSISSGILPITLPFFSPIYGYNF